MNNKNKFFMPIFTLLFLANGITYGMNLTKQKIQNIIDNDAIEIKSTHANDQTELRFYHNDILLGQGHYGIGYYQTDDGSKAVELTLLETEKAYRSSGIGEKLFYKTMSEIHKEFPELSTVYCIIVPYDAPENISSKDAYRLLYRFYRRVGMTVYENCDKAVIHLKEAGYFDEN